MYYIIDRFEENFAVLEDENFRHIDIHRSKLPEDAAEGDVLCFNGGNYMIDRIRTQSRKHLIEEKMRRVLKKI